MIYVAVLVLLGLALVLLLLLAFATAGFGANDKPANFNERFPPINDEEFIRRCRPGVNRSIALRVRRILSDSLGIDYERIYPEQSIGNDLMIDD